MNVAIFLGIIAAIAIFFIIVMIIDCNRFVIREYTVTSEKLKKSGRFILLSDLHNKSFGKDNQRLIKAIDKQNPDAILIAGDMYTSAKNENNMASLISKNYSFKLNSLELINNILGYISVKQGVNTIESRSMTINDYEQKISKIED